MRKPKLIAFAAAALVFTGCAQKPKEITLLAAASLEPCMTQIIEQYEKESGTKITASYGASGQLSMQIINGAAADIFISAGQKQMDDVVQNGFSKKSEPLLKNNLVLVSAEKIDSIELLKNEKTIAIGETQTVPAGQYAKAALESLGLWDELCDKMVFMGNVREVLTAVKTKNASAGFVYETDAALESDLYTLVMPKDSYPQILYPICAMSSEAKAFYEHLFSDKARDLFVKYGFTPEG